jgi:hypothetical protein
VANKHCTLRQYQIVFWRNRKLKEEKFQKIVEEISEFLGDHALRSHHYLFDEDIIKIFSQYKKKHVKRALEEVR